MSRTAEDGALRFQHRFAITPDRSTELCTIPPRRAVLLTPHEAACRHAGATLSVAPSDAIEATRSYRLPGHAGCAPSWMHRRPRVGTTASPAAEGRHAARLRKGAEKATCSLQFGCKSKHKLQTRNTISRPSTGRHDLLPERVFLDEALCPLFVKLAPSWARLERRR